MAIVTNAALCNVKLKADEIFEGGQWREQYTANAEAARAVLNEQTAVIRPITGRPEKDNVVEVSWIDQCSAETEACPDDWCDFTAAPLNTQRREYNLNLCRSVGFSIDENDIAGSYYSREEVFALGELKRKSLLDEYLAQQVLLALKANTGANMYPEPYTYNAASRTTEVPAADYNRKLLAYFEKVAMKHQIRDPYYIDNGALWTDFRNAEFDRGDCCGKGDGKRLDAWRLYFDMFNFGKANIDPDDTFLVGKNAVAIANRWYNPDQPEEFNTDRGTQIRYNVLSNNLPGIRYDVLYKLTCSGKRFIHSWLYIVTAGVFINPSGCGIEDGEGNQSPVTGILGFDKDISTSI